MKRNLIIALVAVVAMGAGVAMAQSTTYEVKQGEVLHVYGNHLVVKMADGTVRDVDVPADFRFDIDGNQVPVSALEPGTILTQTIATTTTPEVVKTYEARNSEVIQRKGQTVILRREDGSLNMVTGIPEGFVVFRDGKQVPIEALAGGDKITAYIVHKETTVVTEQEMGVSGTAPAPVPKPAPVAAPAPAPKPAPVLPKTASNLPLVGLAGLLALALGLGIAVIRR